MAAKEKGKKKFNLKGDESFSFLVEIWSSSAGKVGIVLLVILIFFSLYATATMPPDFINLWESAAYWDENPYLAPPAWIRSLGIPSARHYVGVKTNPDVSYSTVGKVFFNYIFSYELMEEAFPQDLTVKIIGLKVPIVNGQAITPSITLMFSRPDSLTMVVARLPISIPPSYTDQANGTIELGSTQAPIRLAVDYRSLTISIFEFYNLNIPENIIGKDESLKMLGKIIILNKIEEIAKRYRQEVLFGTLDLTVQRKDQTRNIIKILELLNETINSISNKDDYIEEELLNLRNILKQLLLSNSTLSEYITTLKLAQNKILEIWKNAFIEMRLPSEDLNKLYGINSILSSYINQLTQTDAFFDVELHTKPLKGVYTITISISYEAKSFPINIEQAFSPVNEVRVVVKGSAYGIMGTDDLGRDIAQLLLYGFPIALGIGVFAAVITTMLGFVLGLISGFYGGWIDEIIQRTADIIGNIPWLPFLIITAQVAQIVFATYPPATKALMIMLTILGILILTGWGGLAITVRAMVLSIKEEPYVEAAIALGASNRRVLLKHIAPQVTIYVMAALVSSVPTAILTEAGLSVLGIRHGWPTWGAVLSRARDLGRYDVWWWIIPPGILLALTSFTFIMLGFALEKIVEPRLRTL